MNTRLSLEMIVSGGQRGADLAGLMAGRTMGLQTGGIAPKGYRIKLWNGQDGFDQSLQMFGLLEHESPEYEPRTIANVDRSDATLWLGYANSPGFLLVDKTGGELHRPLIVNPGRIELVDFLRKHEVKRLNVAGSVTSCLNPTIFDDAYLLLTAAIMPLLGSNQALLRDASGFRGGGGGGGGAVTDNSSAAAKVGGR